jgi:DNA-binding cell septation regulator SpoVG
MEENITLNAQHYDVGLPYVREREHFPDSRQIAFHIIRCKERKITRLDLVEQYNEKVSEYVKKGYADVVQDIRVLKGRTNLWYLPHQRWRSGNFKSWRHRKDSDELVRRGDWPLGRLGSVYPGDDGVVRVVRLKTSNGYLKDPVAKLAVVVLNDGKYSSIGE